MRPTSRVATDADIPTLIELARQHVEASPLAVLGGFDFASAFNTFKQCIHSPDMEVFTSGTGYLIGAITALPFNENAAIAQEIGWFETAKGGRVMLDQYEEWARSKGASVIAIARLEGMRDNVLDKAYRRYGYAVAEHHYIKEA